MTEQTCRWRLRFVVWGISALTCGIVLAPGHAQASCGDSVFYPHTSGREVSHKAAIPDLLRTQQTDQLPAGSAPCSGPFCSRIPLGPPAVPTSPLARSVDEDGGVLLSPRLFVAQPRPFGCFEDDAPSRPVRFSSDIFHPPR